MDTRKLATVCTVTGLGLLGYGALILLEVLAHEASAAGIASLVLGLLLLVPALRSKQRGNQRGRRGAQKPTHAEASVARQDRLRALLVAAIGAVAVVGVLAYNAVVGFDLGGPELGLLGYGALLLLAAPNLARTVGPVPVAQLVGWSFPLLLAPLLLFSVNAILSGPAGLDAGTAARPLIITALVVPMAAGLQILGTPTEVVGDNVVLATQNGSLSLGVGLVCAGLYPMVLFLGILGLHAWQNRLGAGRFAAYLGAGFLGLYFLNLVRLVMLAKVGQRWGGEALQTAHAHLGWLLFSAFMALFWYVVLRHIERSSGRREPTPDA